MGAAHQTTLCVVTVLAFWIQAKARRIPFAGTNSIRRQKKVHLRSRDEIPGGLFRFLFGQTRLICHDPQPGRRLPVHRSAVASQYG
jgi:hypothetical protein